MLMMILIPNFGDAKIRLPTYQNHIPVLIGGTSLPSYNPVIPSIY